MAGLAYLVPARIPASARNVTWSARIVSDKAGVSFTWKWAAAVYTSLTTTYGNLSVVTVDGTRKAGCPDSYRTNVVAGAKGNGGTNYTGNYSSTSSQTCSAGTRTMSTLSATIAEDSEDLLKGAGLQLNVLPNPSETYFNLTINSDKDLPVTVILRDIFGRVLQKKERIGANGTIRFGDNWTSGTYFAEVIQGEDRRILKVVKVN
ncbi:MAG: T9SS type A sorting domain-containing protein [Chitinophagaceae bacterium]|nr:T9SS type A sorting domain-containing protein [Chitinophagaceae bacterium]